MNARRRLYLLFVLAAVGGLVTAGHARADGQRHRIDSGGTGAFVDDGDGNPLTIRTKSRIPGAGLLQGTIEGNFTILSVSDEGIALYTGTFVITTPQGTLTCREDGLFDMVGGAFVGVDTVIGGTGRFAGATGGFLDTGELAADGSFTFELVGILYLRR